MKLTFTDAETTYVVKNDKLVPLPYHSENKLVSFGWCDGSSDVDYRFVHHTEAAAIDVPVDRTKRDFQAVLDSTNLLVAHNIKFDLGWYRAVGFVYDGPVWDTQVAEYVISRGQKWPLSLKACCDRHKTAHSKLDVVEEYFENRIPTDQIPSGTLREYGIGDHLCLRDLYFSQMAYLAKPENAGLLPTIRMMNEFIYVLIEMERNGLAINRDTLASIKAEFQTEKLALDQRVLELTNEAMGDRPYNLASPEQLSQVMYSRKVIDKTQWALIFNIGAELRGAVLKQKYKTKMSLEHFKHHVRANTTVVFKEKAKQCDTCMGARKTPQMLSGGRSGKRLVICKACHGTGITYTSTGKVAGFKLIPSDANDAAAGGFATDKETIIELAETTKDPKALEFIKTVSRINALDTYIHSFVEGIEKHVLADGILHPGLNQCITATGRLSSSNPNFQNLPRGNTFPVKRAIVSRFPGGSIIACDYAGLEFRAAIFQSQDKKGMEDIKNKVDPHGRTRDVLRSGGQYVELTDKEARQQSKPVTFRPLYGGISGTEAERVYNKWFLEYHEGIAKWQQFLQDEAIAKKNIVLPTGREYAFPDAVRTKWGGSTFATQIKNYPVQGFATGDLVPLGILLVYYLMKPLKLKSLLILDVHDEALTDCYPGEEEIVIKCLRDGMLGVVEEMVRRYDIYFNIPLGIEVKAGPSWLECKEIATYEHKGIERP